MIFNTMTVNLTVTFGLKMFTFVTTGCFTRSPLSNSTEELLFIFRDFKSVKSQTVLASV